MITPKFTIDQDDNFVILQIYCPFMRGKEMEFTIDGQEFRFSGSPYFLRLRFSQDLVEDGTEKCTWNVDEGILNILLPKKNKSEFFSDLDMLSKLLFTKRQLQEGQSSCKSSKGPSIQEISSSSTAIDSQPEAEEEEDWEIEQNLPPSMENIINKNTYGFDLAYHQVFDHFDEAFEKEIFGYSTIECSTSAQRKSFRLQQEKENFSIDHYLYDFVDEEGTISSLLQNALWSSKEYSDRERQELTNLKIKEKYFIMHREIVFFGLLELILAYCLTMRIFEEDLKNSEFAWCFVNLSPMLCSLEATSSVGEVLKNFIHRSLIFPLYRNWNLTLKAIQDSIEILSSKSTVLKALIGAKIALDHDECRYIFSRIALNDYCGWIQSNSFDQKGLESLCSQLISTAKLIDKSWFSISDLHQVEQLLLDEEEAIGIGAK